MRQVTITDQELFEIQVVINSLSMGYKRPYKLSVRVLLICILCLNSSWMQWLTVIVGLLIFFEPILSRHEIWRNLVKKYNLNVRLKN